MDEKTRLLVCLGAAAAANCIPCFEYYYQKAQAAGVNAAELEEAAECAYKIKSNINMLMKNRVRGLLGLEKDACTLPPEKCTPKCC